MELDGDLKRMLLEIRDGTAPLKSAAPSRISKKAANELTALHRQQVLRRLLQLELIEETRAAVSNVVQELPDGSLIRPRHRKGYALTKKGHEALQQE